jgi:hypothetical protein
VLPEEITHKPESINYRELLNIENIKTIEN